MHAQPLTTRPEGVGGVFQDKPPMPRHRLPPQIFTRGDFFENKTSRKIIIYGQTSETASLSR
jgi:hypothetical protein